MNVGHLDDEVVQRRQRKQYKSLIVHVLKVEEVLDDTLDLGVVKPRHLGHLGHKHDHHLDHLLVTANGLLLHHKVDQEVFYPQLLGYWNLRPVLGEQIFEG